jgi:hypothetical protein
MPEPPSLTGAAPGMWRISFAVPAALAPDLGGRAWLQFGAVVVPLPAAVEPLGGRVIGDQPQPAMDVQPEPVQRTPPDAAERPHPSDELEAEAARRRAADAEVDLQKLAVQVEGLERELAEAHAVADGLSTSLAGQEQARRVAEQRAHAERAQRLDLTRRLAEQTRERDRNRQALGDLATAEERIRKIEQELAAARRRIDQAEQLAATANTARARAEQRAGEASEQLGRLSARPSERVAPAELELLGLEHGLIAQRAAAERRRPREPRAPAVVNPRPQVLGLADEPAARIETLVVALRTELDVRLRTETKLRARLVDAEARLAAREQLAERTGGVLMQLREELDGLRAAVTQEREARQAAERHADTLEHELSSQRERSHHAYEAIVELREEIDAIRAVAAAAVEPEPEPEPEPEVEVEPEAAVEVETEPAVEVEDEVELPAEAAAEPEAPDRLSEALVRLRDVIPPLDAPPAAEAAPEPEPEPEPEQPAVEPAPEPQPPEAEAQQPEPEPEAPPKPEAAARPEPAAPEVAPPAKGGFANRAWLQPVFRSLTKKDPDRAGRLLVDLLPAQRALHPDPIAYDLILGGDRGCARVTVGGSGSRVVLEESPRDAGEVDFQVNGDYAEIAQLLAAGPIRRRFGRNVARVHGNRKGVAALEALVALRLDLVALYREGVRMHPRTALTVAAELIEPEWTIGVRFCIAYESRWAETVYLVIDDGAQPRVADEAPDGLVSTAFSGQAGAFELLLTGARPMHATLTGDEWPLTLVGKWIKRAQSG